VRVIMDEKTGIQERLYIVVTDEDGNVVDTRETYRATTWQKIKKFFGFKRCYSNDIIVNQCLEDMAAYIAGYYNYISVGTGITDPDYADTGLEAEILSRTAAATSITTTFYTNDTAVFRGTFTPGYDVTITESGLHTQETSSGDRLAARETFEGMSVPGLYAFTIEWNLVVMR